MSINVGIFLYNEIEVLDFAGPFEVFSTASRVNSRLSGESENLFNFLTLLFQKPGDSRGICRT